VTPIVCLFEKFFCLVERLQRGFFLLFALIYFWGSKGNFLLVCWKSFVWRNNVTTRKRWRRERRGRKTESVGESKCTINHWAKLCRFNLYFCTHFSRAMTATLLTPFPFLLYPLRTRWGTYLGCCSQEGRSSELRLRRGVGQAAHTLNNPQVECTGVLLCESREYSQLECNLLYAEYLYIHSWDKVCP